MLRIWLAEILGIAVLLWPGNGIADDAAPRAKPTSPAKMGCRDYANSHTGQSGLTTPTFHVSSYAIAVKSKSAAEFCATSDVSKLSVTKDVSSYYWVWAVTDAEKACDAAAAKRNSTVKGYEQEHINDAVTIVAAQTTKLRDSLKDKVPVCAASGAAAQAALKKIFDPALAQSLTDTQSEWSKAVKMRDGSGSHTYPSDCSCAP